LSIRDRRWSGVIAHQSQITRGENVETVDWGIGIAGTIALFAGSIWFLVVAFQQEIIWGLACLFIPFVSLIFLIKYWNKASKPFAVWVAGILGILLGKLIREGTIF
jgi:hypothetical protein